MVCGGEPVRPRRTATHQNEAVDTKEEVQFLRCDEQFLWLPIDQGASENVLIENVTLCDIRAGSGGCCTEWPSEKPCRTAQDSPLRGLLRRTRLGEEPAVNRCNQVSHVRGHEQNF